MKRRRHTPEQIVRKLREADRLLGEEKDIAEVVRHLEVSEATLHRWRNQYGGMKAEGAKRLRELERENGRLKQVVAEQALDIQALKEIGRGKPERSPDDLDRMASRMLKLRRPGVCIVCGSALPAGVLAWWDAEKRTVTCATCRDTTAGPVAPETARPEPDRGRPGASVAREYDRRKRNREALTRKAHPWIAISPSPRHMLA